MLKKHRPLCKPSQITPKDKFFNRREVIAALGGVALGSAVGTARANLPSTPWPQSLIDEHTPLEKYASYNNFYELGTGKSDPQENADLYQSRPWKVMVDGAVAKPAEYDVDELLGLAGLQERVYRLRCVEAWSMVVPWLGFPLNELMKKVEPTSKAKYVAFQTFNPLDLFPDDTNRSLEWPYVEGLRIDEAAHDLTLLTFGAYGEELLNQSGAPMRIVVPWKYGYKSAKALVRISFVEEEPPTSWSVTAPREYGFFSNVNPERPHPRWSQARERAVGGGIFPIKRDTEKFNGYTEVASLYTGMDLIVNH